MKKIIIQLAKEFWIPLVITLTWSAYGLLHKPFSEWVTSETVNASFVIFFGLSFWFGQWNRVKKQLRVDEGLTGIEIQVAKMLQNLDEKTRDLLAHISGGDSFCHGAPMLNMPGYQDQILWTFIHAGQFPLYDVQVRIHDSRYPIFRTGVTLNLGTLFPGRAHTFGGLAGASAVRTPIQSFNLFFVARNGSWTQEIRWMEKPGVIATANRVLRDGKPISEPLLLEVSPEYEGKTPTDDAWNEQTPGLMKFG